MKLAIVIILFLVNFPMPHDDYESHQIKMESLGKFK